MRTALRPAMVALWLFTIAVSSHGADTVIERTGTAAGEATHADRGGMSREKDLLKQGVTLGATKASYNSSAPKESTPQEIPRVRK